MKSDALFYRLFRLDPNSLFELTGLGRDVDYTFESITIKTTEKRLDGFFKPVKGRGPNIFVEVQGYPDDTIYFRIFREIFTVCEQDESKTPFTGVVLFLEKRYDPDDCPVICRPPNQFIRIYLKDALQSVASGPSALTVLKPFVLKSKKYLPKAVRQWESEIQALPLQDGKKRVLMELLEYAILERFKTLTLKEVQIMLKLTPLDKTTAGKELIQIGLQEGVEIGEKKGEKKGINKGELIGKIRLAQEILRLPVSTRRELSGESLKTLKEMFQQVALELKL